MVFITDYLQIFFAAASTCTKNRFFFLPNWWEYLGTTTDKLGQCKVKFNFPSDILLVGLAVLDALLRIAGFVAVIAIMVAGAQHLFSGGNPEKAASARKRALNGIIGLAIALLAASVVSYIGRRLAP